MPDVIVIGAGVIGAACAWRLAQAGLQVVLLERNAPGSEASQAALGVLQYHAKPGVPMAYEQLSQRSQQLYPALLDELAAVTGERIPFRAGGQLNVALVEGDLADLDDLYRTNAELGLPVEQLSPDECRLLEPAIAPTVLGGVLFPNDAWIDNTALTLALVQAAQAAGARLERAAVSGVLGRAGRVTGVQAGARTYPADWVVLAAGAWSSQITGVPPLPVRPVRGQALAVEGQPVRRVVASPRGYLVPKGNTQTLVGATVEFVGYDTSNTLGGLAEVSAAGLELAPRLRGCPFMGAWAGLRPGTPDGLPFLGPFRDLPNLIVAAGHFRNGILAAPGTAEAVCALITGAAPAVDLTPLLPERVIPAGAAPLMH